MTWKEVRKLYPNQFIFSTKNEEVIIELGKHIGEI